MWNAGAISMLAIGTMKSASAEMDCLYLWSILAGRNAHANSAAAHAMSWNAAESRVRRVNTLPDTLSSASGTMRMFSIENMEITALPIEGNISPNPASGLRLFLSSSSAGP